VTFICHDRFGNGSRSAAEWHFVAERSCPNDKVVDFSARLMYQSSIATRRSKEGADV
jgi:hypothetical protein